MVVKLQKSIHELKNIINEVNKNLNHTSLLISNNVHSNTISDEVTSADIDNKELVFFEYIDKERIKLLEKENQHLKQELLRHKRFLKEISQDTESLIKEIKG